MASQTRNPLNLFEKELATFEATKDRLLTEAGGHYVLIRGDEIVGTYESYNDAVDEGYRHFGNVPFLVKQIVPVEIPLDFATGHLDL
jgi:hypothetical protein